MVSAGLSSNVRNSVFHDIVAFDRGEPVARYYIWLNVSDLD